MSRRRSLVDEGLRKGNFALGVITRSSAHRQGTRVVLGVLRRQVLPPSGILLAVRTVSWYRVLPARLLLDMQIPSQNLLSAISCTAVSSQLLLGHASEGALRVASDLYRGVSLTRAVAAHGKWQLIR
jgi:hypothetical protein